MKNHSDIGVPGSYQRKKCAKETKKDDRKKQKNNYDKLTDRLAICFTYSLSICQPIESCLLISDA